MVHSFSKPNVIITNSISRPVCANRQAQPQRTQPRLVPLAVRGHPMAMARQTQYHTDSTFAFPGSSISSEIAFRNAGPGWTNTKKWTSFEIGVQEEYRRIRNHISTSNVTPSPFLPTSYSAYLSHRVAILGDKIEERKCAIAGRKDILRAQRKNPRLAEVVLAPRGKGRSFESFTMHPAGSTRNIEVANRAMDGDDGFRARAEFLVGQDLVQKL